MPLAWALSPGIHVYLLHTLYVPLSVLGAPIRGPYLPFFKCYWMRQYPHSEGCACSLSWAVSWRRQPVESRGEAEKALGQDGGYEFLSS